MEQKSNEHEIRTGLLVMAVLRVIGAKQCYASEILERLALTEFATQEGTLYPMLSRLKREGMIEHQWVESPSGPPRKYFSLSSAGRKRLKDLSIYLTRLEKELTALGGERK